MSCGAAGGHVPHDGQSCGHLLQVCAAHRVAVHRRVIEWRHRIARLQVLGQDAMAVCANWNALGWKGRTERQDRRQMVSYSAQQFLLAGDVGASGPALGSVRILLLFPEWSGRVYPGYEFFYGREGLATVRGGNGGEEGDIANRQIPSPVGYRNPMEARSLRELLRDLLQDLVRAGVGGITERRHFFTAVVITHRAHERGDGPGLGVPDLGHHLRDINLSGTDLSKPRDVVHNHYQSAGFRGTGARIPHPGDDHTCRCPAYADPIERGRGHDRQAHTEEEGAKCGDRGSPADDATGLAWFENHRHLLKR